MKTYQIICFIIHLYDNTKYKIRWLIDFNGMSSHQGLFYA